MKKAVGLFLCLVLFFLSGSLVAQVKIKTEITSAKQFEKVVVYTLSASKPFFVGGNRYILYIGDKEFFLNKQWTEDGAGKISFFIPSEDFGNLNDGLNVYLTYGDILKMLQKMKGKA